MEQKYRPSLPASLSLLPAQLDQENWKQGAQEMLFGPILGLASLSSCPWTGMDRIALPGGQAGSFQVSRCHLAPIRPPCFVERMLIHQQMKILSALRRKTLGREWGGGDGVSLPGLAPWNSLPLTPPAPPPAFSSSALQLTELITGL